MKNMISAKIKKIKVVKIITIIIMLHYLPICII